MTQRQRLNLRQQLFRAQQRARQQLTDATVADLRQQLRTAVQGYLSDARGWFGAEGWSAHGARQSGDLDAARTRTQAFSDQVAGLFQTATDTAQQRAYLRSVNAATVAAKALGTTPPASLLTVLTQPQRLQVLGRRVQVESAGRLTFREADSASLPHDDQPIGTARAGYSTAGPFRCDHCIHADDGLCNHPEVIADLEMTLADDGRATIQADGCCTYFRNAAAQREAHRPHITDAIPQTVDTVVEHFLPPNVAAAVKEWRVAPELDAIHGEYIGKGIVRLNPKLADSKEIFGPPTNHLTRLEHTVIHEAVHAFGSSDGYDSSPEWLALSGWQQVGDGPTPHGASRYIEERPGWPPGPSEWAHDADAYFCRRYSSKSPEEDFADCGLWLLAGWDFGERGTAKRDYMAKVIGE